MDDGQLHTTIHRLGRISIALVNIALDDRAEPFTPEDREEVIFTAIAEVSELVKDLGGEIAQRDLARLARLNSEVRAHLGG